MKQDKIVEATEKAIEIPLEFTRSLIEKSKKLRTPSPAVARIGSAIGGCAGCGLLLAGVVLLFTGRPLLAFGTGCAGAVTILSHLICYRRNKKKSSMKNSESCS